MSDEIPEPLTQLAEGAHHLHEMYTEYINAGFPEHRAFELTKLVLTIMLQSNDE